MVYEATTGMAPGIYCIIILEEESHLGNVKPRGPGLRWRKSNAKRGTDDRAGAARWSKIALIMSFYDFCTSTYCKMIFTPPTLLPSGKSENAFPGDRTRS